MSLTHQRNLYFQPMMIGVREDLVVEVKNEEEFYRQLMGKIPVTTLEYRYRHKCI